MRIDLYKMLKFLSDSNRTRRLAPQHPRPEAFALGSSSNVKVIEKLPISLQGHWIRSPL